MKDEAEGKEGELMRRTKKKIKLISVFVALIFAFELFSPVFYGVLEAELYMSVSGNVISEANNVGIHKASVFIVPVISDGSFGQVDAIKTDEKGKYIFSRVPPGKYLLLSYPPKDSNFAADLTPVTITVQRGKNIVNSNFKLKQAGSISGRIFKEDGVTPLANAPVAAFSESSIGFTFSDGNGFYKATNLLGGSGFTVVVIPDGHSSISQENIAVFSGQATGNVDIVLSNKENASLSGVIVNSELKPLVDTYIMLKSNDDGSVAKTDQNGHFRFVGMKAGEYEVEVVNQKMEIIKKESVTLLPDIDISINLKVSYHRDGKFSDNSKLALLSGSRFREGNFVSHKNLFLQVFSLMGNTAYADFPWATFTCACGPPALPVCAALAAAAALVGVFAFRNLPAAAGYGALWGLLCFIANYALRC